MKYCSIVLPQHAIDERLCSSLQLHGSALGRLPAIDGLLANDLALLRVIDESIVKRVKHRLLRLQYPD
jgi:hypothetical protein